MINWFRNAPRLVKVVLVLFSYLVVYSAGLLSGMTGRPADITPTATPVPTSAPTQARIQPTATVVQKTPTPRAQPAHTWVIVKSFTGKGGETTQPFTITASSWRMEWSCMGFQDTNITGSFSVNVTAPDGSIVDSSIDTSNCPGSGAPLTGTSYVYTSGTFYLQIISAGDNWMVKVEVMS